VARRADPQRIYEAKRAAYLERLVSNFGIPRPDAEPWIAAWEREAEARGLSPTERDYWEAGLSWVAMTRAKDRRPPDTGTSP
jgi:hypothetical protein